MAEKPHMNLIFIGHVDHGKSTTVGRLLYETGNVPEQELRKIQDEAKKLGKESFGFAFVMDRLKEERERGLTIDLAHKRFDTKKYYYTIIDAPGHRDFVKNMITGASQADAAVLVVAASEGLMPQTREHAFLAKTLGIGQIVVAVNKMDTVKYDEAKYNEVKTNISNLLKSIGYKPEGIQFIPTAAYVTKENITEKTGESMKWYTGPSIVEILDQFTPPEKPVGKPLRLPVQDVYTITGVGTVPVGRVETGVLKPGDKVVFNPAGASGEIKTVEMHHEQLPKAEPGDNVGFNVRGVGKNDIRRGDVCGHPNSPPTVAEEFTAQIIVLSHPTAITKGYTPVVHCHTAQVACMFTELQKKLNPATGEVVQENPDFLKTGDAAIVKLKPTQPMVIEKASEFPPIGRFAIRDMGQTVAAGLVTGVTPKK